MGFYIGYQLFLYSMKNFELHSTCMKCSTELKLLPDPHLAASCECVATSHQDDDLPRHESLEVLPSDHGGEWVRLWIIIWRVKTKSRVRLVISHGSVTHPMKNILRVTAWCSPSTQKLGQVWTSRLLCWTWTSRCPDETPQSSVLFRPNRITGTDLSFDSWAMMMMMVRRRRRVAWQEWGRAGSPEGRTRLHQFCSLSFNKKTNSVDLLHLKCCLAADVI